ncbi:MAG: heavy metal sensor histidine kinase [Burkholderiales bacterium]|nr:heavy metal sensor histidine kinase [Burkholderiales bacterium]
MRSASITLRLTLFFAIVSTAVLLGVGYLIIVAVQAHFVELDTVELNGKLDLVRHLLAKASSQSDLDAIPQTLDDALVGHPGLSIVILGSDRRVLFASSDAAFPFAVLDGNFRDGRTERAEPTVWEANGHTFRDVVAPVRTGIAGMPSVTVAVAVNIDHQRTFLLALGEKLWIAIAMGAFLTVLLGWIAARRGLAPVREMAAAAKQISATRLDNRIPPSQFPTELRGLAQAFNEMLARLEDSFRRLSDFSSDLAHEMRTPVSNLVTQAEVALARPRSTEEYREVLHSSLEEYARLGRMISDMLFLAKTGNGLIVPRDERVDLAAETRRLFDFYGALAEERDVRLCLDGEGSVGGEALMIRRAISNLLSNAIRHTSAGDSVHVSIDTQESGAIQLCVENTGETIAAEHLSRLFDRFYRVDPSRQKASEGAGLGLAITKSIVEAHGGDIGVTSQQHRTRFNITFPRY